MTLIIGVNLLDKILIASDTRVTINQGHNNLVYDDCVNKTGMLWPLVIWPDELLWDKNYIGVAITGSVKFAAFIFSQLRERLRQGSLSNDIWVFQNTIEVILHEICWIWSDKVNPYNCYLMFFWTCPQRNQKWIHWPNLFERYDRFFKKKPNDDYIFLTPGNAPKMNENIFKILNDHLNFAPWIPEMRLFWVSIQSSFNWVNVYREVAQVGDYLIKGDMSLTQLEEVFPFPKDIFSISLFSEDFNVQLKPLFDIIYYYSQKNKTIGCNIIWESIDWKKIQTYLMNDGNIIINDWNMFLKKWSAILPFQSFYNWSFGEAYLQAEM